MKSYMKNYLAYVLELGFLAYYIYIPNLKCQNKCIIYLELLIMFVLLKAYKKE